MPELHPSDDAKGEQTRDKLERLRSLLEQAGSVLVAYSGGVDSSFLLKVAHDCLGDRVVAVTAVSPAFPDQERSEAEELAKGLGVKHVLMESHEMEDPRFVANPPDRCYFCKADLFDRLLVYAREQGLQCVADGNNADDSGDYRPGRRAARERGVRSPLDEAGLTKAEIRHLARKVGLPNWDKPSAACLSSRIPYGTSITRETLTRIQQAERLLQRRGFRQFRVRDHGQIARLEVLPSDMPAALAQRDEIVTELKGLGYAYVALDLKGFRSGSMNEVLSKSGY